MNIENFSFIPVCIIDDSNILVLKHYSFYVFNFHTRKMDFIVKIKLPFIFKLLSYTSFLSRLFRLVNIVGTKLSDKRFLIAYNSKMYVLDLEYRSIKKIYNLDKGRRPLSFLDVKENSIVEEGIYYGDYCSVYNNEDINIYRVNKRTLNKKIVYTFKNGTVGHIHSMQFDKVNECIWIFTGDFGKAAAIWQVKSNFSNVRVVYSNNQIYRSCISTVYNGELFYATDTPFKQNSLRLVSKKEGKWENHFLYNLNGSVIYGGRIKNYLFFSTAVEPNGKDSNIFSLLFSRRKGLGINDYYTHLYVLDLNTKELKTIYKQKKDLLPYVFQFGTLIFPSGEWKNKLIPVYNVATCVNDLKTTFIQF